MISGMANPTRTLHYGNQTFDCSAYDGNPLDKYDGAAGTMKLNLGAGRWLTVVVGPGIPIAVLEEPAVPGRAPLVAGFA